MNKWRWTNELHYVDTPDGYKDSKNLMVLLHHLYLTGANEKKAVPIVQLKVIRLLAEINVQVNKREVVDMILPLFIENLEEGDASTPVTAPTDP
nr:phosphatidylinositol 4-kinase alpha 1-like isoform X2 [Tanacetum cinerariifolium]